ncbi:sulfatase-like hydrolase/transferase [Paenibacillus guangzhouensis]|uniref:sulfatase-like hydrolase/transferase n=1 Tax=Paenibacillus guangzhouensis TaxID=1473112 RepID=UPI001D0F8F67|nr:sulfatase-like hydrolase/transferase [Paenibacillus guangzhouensis]
MNEMMQKRPNFLVFIVDEQRYPPVYESAALRNWSKNNLVTQTYLRENGVELLRHYIGSAACCPSRATMFTGHYPSMHGVSQTNGIAKSAFDSDMFWLNTNTVPTMGNYMREAGYQTYYKGKWHISYEDIVVPGTHQDVPSYDPNNGVPVPQMESLYAQAGRLESYGFSDWIGPEPHGRNPRNSGSSAAGGVSGRDVVYGSEAARLIEALDQQSYPAEDRPPWLIVASFVNPHDIVLYGSLTEHIPAFNFEVDDGVPMVEPPPTVLESLHTKPRCQASYRTIYPQALQPILNPPFYYRLYYQLQKNADEQMQNVYEALARSSFYDNTIVIFTSDHGDLLGSHGYLHQKWYAAYEEILHVPFVIYNKKLFPNSKQLDALTSHLDLLPTMLGLAQANVPEIQARLKRTFTEVHPFVGRDLSSYLLGHSVPPNHPVFFMTDDDVMLGQHQVSALGRPYPSVVQPNHIETVITWLDTKSADGNTTKMLWKYARYFDPNSASSSTPVPEEFELYNLSVDPLEIRNLAHTAFATSDSRHIQTQMMLLLDQERQTKRLTPATV